MVEALLALKEIQYLGHSEAGPLPQRRDALIGHLLDSAEQRLGLPATEELARTRVRVIRSEVVKRFFALPDDPVEQSRLRNIVGAADLAQDLVSYPDCYLMPGQVTDTRIVETIQRMQESLLGKADSSVKLKVVIDFAEPIPVPTDRAPRGGTDPLMQQLDDRLAEMLSKLSAEARPFNA